MTKQPSGATRRLWSVWPTSPDASSRSRSPSCWLGRGPASRSRRSNAATKSLTQRPQKQVKIDEIVGVSLSQVCKFIYRDEHGLNRRVASRFSFDREIVLRMPCQGLP